METPTAQSQAAQPPAIGRGHARAGQALDDRPPVYGARQRYASREIEDVRAEASSAMSTSQTMEKPRIKRVKAEDISDHDKKRYEQIMMELKHFVNDLDEDAWMFEKTSKDADDAGSFPSFSG